MDFVIDASVVHAWVFGEGRPEADAIKARLVSETAVAPALWWFEVRNGLIVAERRGRFTETESDKALRELSRLPISLDQLAIREALPLATLDVPLQRAARAEGVPLIGEGDIGERG